MFAVLKFLSDALDTVLIAIERLHTLANTAETAAAMKAAEVAERDHAAEVRDAARRVREAQRRLQALRVDQYQRECEADDLLAARRASLGLDAEERL
jgi:hypothetical protein